MWGREIRSCLYIKYRKGTSHGERGFDTGTWRSVRLIKRLIEEVGKSVINKLHIFRLCKAGNGEGGRHGGCFCCIFCSPCGVVWPYSGVENLAGNRFQSKGIWKLRQWAGCGRISLLLWLSINRVKSRLMGRWRSAEGAIRGQWPPLPGCANILCCQRGGGGLLKTQCLLLFMSHTRVTAEVTRGPPPVHLRMSVLHAFPFPTRGAESLHTSGAAPDVPTSAQWPSLRTVREPSHYGFFSFKKTFNFRSSRRGAAEMNPTRNHEVVRSISGLPQWVKAWILCCCGCGLGWHL